MYQQHNVLWIRVLTLYFICYNYYLVYLTEMGAQWLSGRVLDSRQGAAGSSPTVVSLSKNSNPMLVLVQPRKARPFITEILLMGCNESNQTNKFT